MRPVARTAAGLHPATNNRVALEIWSFMLVGLFEFGRRDAWGVVFAETRL